MLSDICSLASRVEMSSSILHTLLEIAHSSVKSKDANTRFIACSLLQLILGTLPVDASLLPFCLSCFLPVLRDSSLSIRAEAVRRTSLGLASLMAASDTLGTQFLTRLCDKLTPTSPMLLLSAGAAVLEWYHQNCKQAKPSVLAAFFGGLLEKEGSGCEQRC